MSAESRSGAPRRALAPARPLNSGASGFIAACSPAARPPIRLDGSRACSSEDKQVVRDHPQPDPALHPARPSVPTSPQPVTTFECADASFTAGAPSECRARCARSLLTRPARQDDLPDPTGLRGALVAARGEATIGNGQVRRAIEERDVPIESGLPQAALGLPALTHLVIGRVPQPLGH